MLMSEKLSRVRYGKCPLVEVVFQLRFPTILSINANPPIEFQDKIRRKYPYFENQLEEFGDVLLSPQQRTASMRKLGENKNYAFISEDYLSKVNLTPSFIALSTMAYTQWEEFKENISYIIPIFELIYQPSFYSRIGLRYKDVITRSEIGLSDCSWTELIKPHVLGMVTQEHEEGIKAFSSEIEYETKEANVLSRSHIEFVHVNDQPEMSLLIDCDYFTLGITKLAEMDNKSDKLHNASSLFIQTAITRKLHYALEPVEINQ